MADPVEERVCNSRMGLVEAEAKLRNEAAAQAMKSVAEKVDCNKKSVDERLDDHEDRFEKQDDKIDSHGRQLFRIYAFIAVVVIVAGAMYRIFIVDYDKIKTFFGG